VTASVLVEEPCRRCGRLVVKTRSLATGRRMVLDPEPTAGGVWQLDSVGYALPARRGEGGLAVHLCAGSGVRCAP
jgi:hypothetical protein